MDFNFPNDFLNRMSECLGNETEAFLRSFDRSLKKALRINPLKINEDRFKELTDIELLDKVPWCPDGFYIDGNSHPGKSVLHDAGAFYVQEPSAMAVAELLMPERGDIMLDLCAAPGGKTTHIAGKMKDAGFLVSNEINFGRAKILSKNVERMGIGNCIVTSNTPEELCNAFGCFFDKILIDAPCSGEGMFRTKEVAISQWSLDNIGYCVKRAKEILRCAIPMLKPGGIMVYSTCTFEVCENEEMINYILSEFPEMERCDEAPEYIKRNLSPGIYQDAGTYRVWPHRQDGEGHFLAKLKKRGEYNRSPFNSYKCKKNKLLDDFFEDCGITLPDGRLIAGKDEPALTPFDTGGMSLRVLRNGVKLGTIKKDRFEPDHALALYLSPGDIKKVFDMADPYAFLAGDSIPCDKDVKGWGIAAFEGLSLGWGKATGGVVKNHYPRGLRRNR